MEILAVDVERGGEALKRALTRSEWRASRDRSGYMVQGNRKAARAVRRYLRRMRPVLEIPPRQVGEHEWVWP